MKRLIKNLKGIEDILIKKYMTTMEIWLIMNKALRMIILIKKIIMIILSKKKKLLI